MNGPVVLNVDPEGGEHETLTLPSTRSAADEDHVIVAVSVSQSTIRVISFGTLTVGPVVSSTRTTNVSEPMLPAMSVAVHDTTVSPNGKHVAGLSVALDWDRSVDIVTRSRLVADHRSLGALRLGGEGPQ